MNWHDAVVEALRRYSSRHATRIIRRPALIAEELERIVQDTGSTGETPSQTLSRVLQELRDEGLLYFQGDGSYLLVDGPVPVEMEDLPDESLDFLVRHNRLAVGRLPTADRRAVARIRVGQARLRRATLANYGYCCALCDVADRGLLVAGHISRWADDPEGRGDLTNLVCMCRFHDVLFEQGYFSLTDDYAVLRRENIRSRVIRALLPDSLTFRLPEAYPPASKYLRVHRSRFGFPLEC